MTTALVSDQEFIAALRDATDRYFAAVDQWEAANSRFYRMPGAAKPSGDLEAEQREFENRRRELEELLPRARFLCFKHDRPDVFAGLAHVSLGQYAPQQRTDSAIGRGERNAVITCLIDLGYACRDRDADPPPSAIEPPAPQPRPSLFDRIIALFW
jgi:hypothetical protein